MNPLIVKDRQGNRFQICNNAWGPSGRGHWQRVHLDPMQAFFAVQKIERESLQEVASRLQSYHFFGALYDPGRALTRLLDERTLRLYQEAPPLTKVEAKAPTDTPEALYLQIRGELKLILVSERHQAKTLDARYQTSSTIIKGLSHGKAAGLGVLQAGASLATWLSDINDVINPVWHLKRRLEAALETYEEYASDKTAKVDAELIQRYLSRVTFKDHKELTEALGFDPTSIDPDTFSEAWHTAWLLAGDKTIVALFREFAKDYISAQHSLELSHAAGGAVFEILLTLLLAIATGGVGAAASLGSKAHHLSSFQRLGHKLKRLAVLLASMPRGIKRRRQPRVKIGQPAKQKMTRASGGQVDSRSNGVTLQPGDVVPDRKSINLESITAKDIPSFKSGGFNDWFDARSPEELSALYQTPAIKNKISHGLRGAGGNHEFMMVVEAPQWSRWGVKAQQVQEDFAIPISALNEGGLAKGWKHSTGIKGSKSPGSKIAHNELQSVIQQSNSLSDYKSNMKVWSEKWINGGYDALPPGFHK